jgi:hypothetical protein
MDMYTTHSTLYTMVALTLIILFCKNVKSLKKYFGFQRTKFCEGKYMRFWNSNEYYLFSTMKFQN